jgi:hypothetical protein
LTSSRAGVPRLGRWCGVGIRRPAGFATGVRVCLLGREIEFQKSESDANGNAGVAALDLKKTLPPGRPNSVSIPAAGGAVASDPSRLAHGVSTHRVYQESATLPNGIAQ